MFNIFIGDQIYKKKNFNFNLVVERTAAVNLGDQILLVQLS